MGVGQNEAGRHEDAAELTVAQRWREVRDRIDRAARDVGRDPGQVKLVSVSKTYGPEAIEPVLEIGARVFGENRVQEASAKWPGLRQRFAGVELHLIGPLQTNKVREAIDLFDVIETVDRPHLAEVLAKETARLGRSPALYVEVNTGAEPQKAGILPDAADAFIDYCRGLGLVISGLMCIPPAGQQAAPHFALLADIARRNSVAKLSMGMSADYEIAVELGATHVRVGTAIFGSRAPATNV